MRARRRDRHLLIAAILVIVGVWLLAAHRVDAAPRATATCWWDGSTVHAAGLPTTRLFGITYNVPHGVWLATDDGTFSRAGPAPGALTIYTRGGGGALFKWGAQFNDYHPICVAIP